ncbi:hypothetical protein FKW77_003142 [Venturia effusa]|uniref:DNA repair protein rad5 n=1 Tax=Venturia effusa TaxID=50376 RepID=A0A517LIG0_9PEZI|nr:hypothetical protein FKW77_003142 [Venturia effusa]
MADRPISAIVAPIDDSEDEILIRPRRPHLSMSSQILVNSGGSGGRALTSAFKAKTKRTEQVNNVGIGDNMEIDKQEAAMDMIEDGSQLGKETEPGSDDLSASGTGEKGDRYHSSSEASESDYARVESDQEDIVTPFLKSEAEYEKLRDSGNSTHEDIIEFEAEKKVFYETLIKKDREKTVNRKEKEILESRGIKPLPKAVVKTKSYHQSVKAFSDRQKDHPVRRNSARVAAQPKVSPAKGTEASLAAPGTRKRGLAGADFGQKKKRKAQVATAAKKVKCVIREEDYLGDEVRNGKGVTQRNAVFSSTGQNKKGQLLVTFKLSSTKVALDKAPTKADANATAAPASSASSSPPRLTQTSLSSFVTKTSRPLDPDMKRLLSDHIQATKTASGDQKEIDRNIKYFTARRRPKKMEGTSESKSLYILEGLVTLLKAYQVIGVGWMRKREADRPADSKEPSGGILADDMGLGKSIMAIANLLDGRPYKRYRKTNPQVTLIIAPPTLIDHWKKEFEKHVEEQLSWQVYTSSTAKSTNAISSAFDKIDIVFTTYEEVRNSCPPLEEVPENLDEQARESWYKNWFDKKGGLLHKFHFHRIYLDEAQHIKNEASMTSLACRCLIAKHRWLLTGTPLTDKIIELYAFFKFLRVPYTGYRKEFRQNYCDPRDVMHLQRLKFIIQTYMLRRTHHDQLFGKKLLQLPHATQTTIWLELGGPELVVYTEILRYFIELAKDSDDNTLSLRLNEILRQTLSHPLNIQRAFAALPQKILDRIVAAYMMPIPKDEIFPENIFKLHRQIFGETENAELSRGGQFGQRLNFKTRYLPFLKTSMQEECTRKSPTLCSKCGKKPPTDKLIMVNSCGHVFCKKCVESIRWASSKAKEDAFCPEKGCDVSMDARLGFATEKDLEPKMKKFLEAANHKESESSWIDLKAEGILSSTKCLAAKVVILNWIRKDPDCKIIIFTNYRDTQNILRKVCEIEGWGCRQINGDTGLGRRAKCIEEFGEEPDIRVLLASVKVGGVGLNLTAANRVLLMEPWWNDATEQQAFSRVCRIGQRSKTGLEFVRLRYRGTVDEKIFGMQEFKTFRINQVIERREGQPIKISEALELFSPDGRTDGGEPFIYVDDTQLPASWFTYTGPHSGDECEETPDTSDEEPM